MVSHGFGKPDIKSGKIDDEEIIEIARQISLVEPVVRAHVVRRVVCGEEVGLHIIFEYPHLAKRDMTPAHLLKALQAKVQVGEHQIASSSEFWVIQRTYQHGEPIEYQPKQ